MSAAGAGHTAATIAGAPIELVVRARRVALPAGTVAAAIAVAAGRIAAITAVDAPVPAGLPVVDLGEDEVLLPGFVDSHVHVDEPGRTHWEGFATATAAAAAGGITTLVDMPLNSVPPTVDVDALRRKQDAARDQVAVDVAFWGGAVPMRAGTPDATGRVDPGAMAGLVEAGVCGFKCFLADSGVPEFPSVGPEDLELAAEVCARLGVPLIVHAEDGGVLANAQPTAPDYRSFLDSRPIDAEVIAVRRLASVASRTGARVHILHVSASDAAEEVAAARAAGLPITAETCPHYLSLEAETLTTTAAKCCPPIRSRDNRERLWAMLASGVLDVVVSDHSPCPPELKVGGFARAWGGVSSLELASRVMWTEAYQRGHGVDDLVRWMAAGPASLAGLVNKGVIAPGADADLVAFGLEEMGEVDPARLRQRHPHTPYAGRVLRGSVRRVWRRGVDHTLAGRGQLITPGGQL